MDLLETECDQGEHCLVCLFLLGRRRMHSARCFPSSSYPELVLQFENNSFSRLFSETADFGNRGDIRIHNCGFEIGYAHPAQDGKRQLRPEAADVVDEQPKKITLGWRHESIKHVCILTYGQMRQNAYRLSNRRQLVIARKRNEDFVAGARYVDRCLRAGGGAARE